MALKITSGKRLAGPPIHVGGKRVPKFFRMLPLEPWNPVAQRAARRGCGRAAGRHSHGRLCTSAPLVDGWRAALPAQEGSRRVGAHGTLLALTWTVRNPCPRTIMLIKLASGDLRLDKPIDFAIYNADGTLLLQKGQVVTSDILLQRLYRLGYRSHTVRTGKFGLKPVHVPVEEKNPALSMSAEVQDDAASEPVEEAAIKLSALPDLSQKVEFFHLMTPDTKDALRVELVGVIPGQALIVQCADDADALAAGVSYEARLFAGARLFRFQTTLLMEAVGPLGCYFLRYPEAVAQAQVRKYQRVATAFAGELSSGEYQRAAVDVRVENVSPTGAGVSAKEDFLLVGKSARLTVNLTIDNRERPITVSVEVRNRRQEGARFVYGLEFSRMPEETRRDIKDFVLETLALM
ncbi:PilZ domain-containing protein [uncultured Ralstonia sp.]|uniref:PilZ domain-containing protein n=2 Tax=Ralstonia TaxID=48736 RepID=UPI0025E98D86|nr:PilZ domain-containing protein [uncultured Ralstonia sp.]